MSPVCTSTQLTSFRSQPLLPSQNLRKPLFQSQTSRLNGPYRNTDPSPDSYIGQASYYADAWKSRLLPSSAPSGGGKEKQAANPSLPFPSTAPEVLSRASDQDLFSQRRPLVPILTPKVYPNAARTRRMNSPGTVDLLVPNTPVAKNSRKRRITGLENEREVDTAILGSHNDQTTSRHIDKVAADQIDTQLLFKKAANRKTARSGKSEKVQEVQTLEAQDSTTDQVPQVEKTLSACQSCRSAHQKCVRPFGRLKIACQRCAHAGLTCSLQEAIEAVSESSSSILPRTRAQCRKAQNTANESLAGDADVPPLESASVDEHAKSVDSGRKYPSHTKRKQNTRPHPPVPPVKRRKKASHANRKGSTVNKHNISTPLLSKPLSPRNSPCAPSVPDLQSDATTLTVDTQDLNRLHRPKMRALLPQQVFNSDPPTISELSENIRPEEDQTTSPRQEEEDIQKSKFAKLSCQKQISDISPTKDVFDMKKGSLSDLMVLDPGAKHTALEDLLRDVLKDDGFHKLCIEIEKSPTFAQLRNELDAHSNKAASCT